MTRHHHLGPVGLTGEWAEPADLAVRPQLGIRHLRLLQGSGAVRRRLQGRGEGTARLVDRGPGRGLGHRPASAIRASATRPPTCARCRCGPPMMVNASMRRRERHRRQLSDRRFLYIYVNKNPNEPLDPLRGEFIRFVYSKEGPGSRDQGRLLPGHQAAGRSGSDRFRPGI
jgi:hypothetical protein